MNNKEQWSVWYAQVFYIEDNGLSKKRPVLILDKNEELRCLVLSITSKEKPDYIGYRLEKPEAAHLKPGSTVLFHEVRMMYDDDFDSYIGKLHPIDVENLIERLSSKSREDL